ncbi:MAG TPA: 3-deoxy-manno-octulosonate cytidylyltransferase [Pirellulaceae bacterium]|nr:3-deoxy-manno-octulosonate cytidylyltransferase [Pirellulaceae bacterium]
MEVQALDVIVAGAHFSLGGSGSPPKRVRQSSAIVIPARLASTRLPRKLLLADTGKPLIQHTYEAALQATRPGGVLVAADSEEIAAAVRRFGGRVELTSPDCASGSDRVAEIACRLPNVDIVVNVQGDEPEISAQAIDLAVELLESDPTAAMSTLAAPIRSRERLLDPSCVKVVLDGRGRAIYFSRAPIPFARTWDDALLAADPPHYYQHIGLYAYRRDFLLQLASLPRPPIERLENLEQLRVLYAGHPILVGMIGDPTTGIDTPDDYKAFVSRCCGSSASHDCGDALSAGIRGTHAPGKMDRRR